jgi:hypothetical protein
MAATSNSLPQLAAAEQRFPVKWLPKHVAAEAEQQEPARFRALVHRVQAIVGSISKQTEQQPPGAWDSLLPYLEAIER